MAYKGLKVGYVDRKGERGFMSFRVLDTVSPVEATVKGALNGLTGAQMDEISVTNVTAFTTPTVLSEDTSVQNDKDLKVHLVFDWPAQFTSIHVSIPAPLINIEGGIVVRWGDRKAFVPKKKETWETGLDGDALAAKIGTLVAGSASALAFSSGSVKKR